MFALVRNLGLIGLKKVIYYFTGTGNSMRAAEKIAAQLGDTEIISMRSNPLDVPAVDADIIGFIYPVYHWTMPEPAVNFVKKLEINSNAYIFTVAMPSFVLGHACEKLEELLIVKGAKIAYGSKVRSVGNYVICYPPIPPPKLVVPKTERKLDKIAEEIVQRKQREIPRAGALIKRRYKKVMTQYKEMQSLADHGFIIDENCTSCRLCMKLCPCYNIEMNENKLTFLRKCSQCMACVCYCPKRAIGYKLPDFVEEQLSGGLLNLLIVKRMGLPRKRKLYRNPYITAADIIETRKHIP